MTAAAPKTRIAIDVHYIDGRSASVGQAQMLGGGADPMAFTHHAHMAVIEDFLDALDHARPPQIDGVSVLPVQRLIDALLESAAKGQVVPFAGRDPSFHAAAVAVK